MISVSYNNKYQNDIKEFFELFKTPWNNMSEKPGASVLITDRLTEPQEGIKLVILYNREETSFDRENDVKIRKTTGRAILRSGETEFPIYRGLSLFEKENGGMVELPGHGPVAFFLTYRGIKVLRVGYDLFDEVNHILKEGQPPEWAHFPTLDVHIHILRNWILLAGIPILEIPPKPYNINHIVCLTHDIDFLGIRNHLFDRTFLGFMVRSMMPFLAGHAGGGRSLQRQCRNFRAVLSLPLVLTGLKRDFWDQLEVYAALENGLSSTFFMIPFKDRPGEKRQPSNTTDVPPRWRAARYDVRQYGETLRGLIGKGCEVGLHGIDAWWDSEKGSTERRVIEEVTAETKIGIRMHWLYFTNSSPLILENAGFAYDSTLGYNDTIGFRSGTTQAFHLPNTEGLFELPLHIQDTALFFRKRMRLSEQEAYDRCRQIVNKFNCFGGALTINWHDRSLVPERNWDHFYILLLDELLREKCWFASGSEAVKWFKWRRKIRFESSRLSGSQVRVLVHSEPNPELPSLQLRENVPDPDGGTKTFFIDRPMKNSVEHVLTI